MAGTKACKPSSSSAFIQLNLLLIDRKQVYTMHKAVCCIGPVEQAMLSCSHIRPASNSSPLLVHVLCPVTVRVQHTAVSPAPAKLHCQLTAAACAVLPGCAAGQCQGEGVPGRESRQARLFRCLQGRGGEDDGSSCRRLQVSFPCIRHASEKV